MLVHFHGQQSSIDATVTFFLNCASNSRTELTIPPFFPWNHLFLFFRTALPSHWNTIFGDNSTFKGWTFPKVVLKPGCSIKLTSLLFISTPNRSFWFLRLVVAKADQLLLSVPRFLLLCCHQLFLSILQWWRWAPGHFRSQHSAHQMWKTPQWSWGQVCIQEFKFCCLRLSVSPALEVFTQGPLHNPQTPIIPFLWAP